MQEKIQNRCCFGELGHPEDRTETNMEKIAICLAEQPKKGKDGKLYGVFDILSTPCGKILKTLLDYGCKVGVSSRGQGDVETDYNGNEDVNPDTFECECWDAVLLPAVKDARPTYVTESLQQKPLTESLQKIINSASEEDKKVITETLDQLNINYTPSAENAVDINVNNEQIAANNAGANMIHDLQEALKQNAQLEVKIATLNEKLSVSYTKEAELNDKLLKSKQYASALNESISQNKQLQIKIKSLQEALQKKNDELKDSQQLVEKYKIYQEKNTSERNQLNESLNSKDETIYQLKKRVNNLNESFIQIKQSLNNQIDELTCKLEDVKKNYEIKNSEYSPKLLQSNKLVEKYKNIAKNAVDKYITIQANKIGVIPSKIKERLSESFSFNDIDKVCEDLMQYRVDISKLPFELTDKKVKVKVNESKEPILYRGNYDDQVDDDLQDLANRF